MTIDGKALIALGEIRRATSILRDLPIESFGSGIREIAEAISDLKLLQREKDYAYYVSPAFQKRMDEERAASEQKRRQKKSLEARVVDWAETNLQEGDFVRFIGTRGNPWRKVDSIERTKFPEYSASRVHGRIISWFSADTIEESYKKFAYDGGSSVNGMEKIAIVVRNGKEVFNRKSVHLK